MNVDKRIFKSLPFWHRVCIVVQPRMAISRITFDLELMGLKNVRSILSDKLGPNYMRRAGPVERVEVF